VFHGLPMLHTSANAQCFPLNNNAGQREVDICIWNLGYTSGGCLIYLQCRTHGRVSNFTVLFVRRIVGGMHRTLERREKNVIKSSLAPGLRVNTSSISLTKHI
jgi:hypothetical protein